MSKWIYTRWSVLWWQIHFARGICKINHFYHQICNAYNNSNSNNKNEIKILYQKEYEKKWPWTFTSGVRHSKIETKILHRDNREQPNLTQHRCQTEYPVNIHKIVTEYFQSGQYRVNESVVWIAPGRNYTKIEHSDALSYVIERAFIISSAVFI